jgi:hypothetical protein
MDRVRLFQARASSGGIPLRRCPRNEAHRTQNRACRHAVGAGESSPTHHVVFGGDLACAGPTLVRATPLGYGSVFEPYPGLRYLGHRVWLRRYLWHIAFNTNARYSFRLFGTVGPITNKTKQHMRKSRRRGREIQSHVVMNGSDPQLQRNWPCAI